MDILPIDIELVNEGQLDENELSGFVETEPMQLGDEQLVVGTRIVEKKNDAELITQFLDGKLTFSEYKCQALDDDDQGSDADDEKEYIMDDEDEEKSDGGSPSMSATDRFESELVSQRKNQLRGQLSKLATGKAGRKKKSVLPPALQGLMGEANLRYARGETELAEKVCMEIIRQSPTAVEPFHTLAQIYEGRDHEKYMQFMLIAGLLNPSDTDHWIHLAELSEEAGNLKQAATCYFKATISAPYEIDLRLKRIDLVRRMGDEKHVLKLQLIMIPYIRDPVYQLQLTKEVAQKYHEMGVPERALIAFQKAHSTNGHTFSVGDVNQFLELLVDARLYEDAINVLCQHTKIELEMTPKTRTTPHSIDSVLLPQDLVPDFRTKASVCLIHLKCPALHEYIVNEALKALDAEELGDCLLDIAEALMAAEDYENAYPLLEPLVESQRFSLAAVWLRFADCLRFLGDTERAIESYRRVIQMAPQHLDARLTLSTLLKQVNKHTEALKALEQDLESDVLDPTLLYEHCYMLKETGNIEQYIDLSGVLFARHCIRFRNREEAELAIRNRRFLEAGKQIREYREFRLEDAEDTEGPEFTTTNDELDKEKEFELLVDVVKQCYDTKRFATMQNYTLLALTSRRFGSYRSTISFMAMVASFASKDYSFSGFFAKDVLLKNPSSSYAWNLYIANQQVVIGLVKYHRFLQRWLQKDVGFDAEVALWKPSYCLAAGTFSTAVRESSENFRRTKAPFSALLTAISLAHLAVQRFSTHKAEFINQAILYMNEYAKVREPEAQQEIYYNSGRLFQQLGVMASAVDFYRKVLACQTDPDPEVAELIDLKKEAAFNLHLIFKESGNLALAKKYLFDFVVI